jgi:hypothetical protein
MTTPTPITNPTALADQRAAATRDARATLGRLAAAGAATLIATTGNAWLTEQAAALAAAIRNGKGKTCSHLHAGPTVAHAAVWAPGHVVCSACVRLLRPSLLEDITCDRCRRHARRLHPGAVALGPVILAYGLCRSCATDIGLYPAPPTADEASTRPA